MTPLTVIVTILCYFGMLLAISAIASRGAGNATFFTGNRRAPWPVVGIAMIGATISGVTFISVPGMVAAKSYSYLQMVMGFTTGYLIIAAWLIPAFYRRHLVSIYGYLNERFGPVTHLTGAWFFFVSKMLGAAVRFFVVCAVLQLIVFQPLGLPFALNVVLTVALIWLYTVKGGVGTLIWTDLLKSLSLILSVTLCIMFMAREMGLHALDIPQAVASHPSSRVFFLDDPMSAMYFWKQFVAGVFLAIATNGLDQDMMQRNMACHDTTAARKNMVLSSLMQFPVIGLFLVLGTLLLLYIDHAGIPMPEKSDELFGLVATSDAVPVAVGVLFVLGLISAAYSAAGSALTSLTTSFTVDILRCDADGAGTAKIRRLVHVAMASVMAMVIIVFYYISDQDAISAVYTLASLTYGPILGLFAFGLFTRRHVADRLMPAVCIASPLLSLILQKWLADTWGYQLGFELLLLNALITCLGCALSGALTHSHPSAPSDIA